MNINSLPSEIKFPNQIGATLSVDQTTHLELAVIKLSENKAFDKYNFWGRIEGLYRNYYIIQGVNEKNKFDFPEKKYFWSSESFKFAELPAPRKEYTGQAIASREGFTGQHQKVLLQGKGDKKVIKNGDEDLVVKPKNFTELDRLSIVVHAIEDQCQVVPLGAYKLAPTHQLIRNPGFRGLKIQEANKLINYVHYRKPLIKEKKLLVESDQALTRLDFLDSLNDQQVKGAWSIQSDESKTQVTIRSLLWTGYLAYHRTNSQIFGGAYFGDGIKNIDLLFII